MVFVLILILGGVASFFGPWWAVAPVCFLLHLLLSRSSRGAFWTSAVAVALLWFMYGVYLDVMASTDFNEPIAGIFVTGLPFLSQVPGIVVTYFMMMLIAVLVGGFSGMAGVQVRKFIGSGK